MSRSATRKTILPLIGIVSLCVPTTTAAADNESVDELGRWLGTTNEAVQRFGAAGETLRDLTRNDFAGAGTGAAKRGLRDGWKAALQPWRNAAQGVRASAPYRVAPAAFLAHDTLTSVIAPAIEGDGRGSVSGVVNIAASAGAAAAGASLFGSIGATAGAYLPMVSTASGAAMIGGAVGPIAAGVLVAYAYDKYAKEAVGSAVEGLIALGDPDPLTQAIRAREDFLRRQAAPELAKEWQRGQDVSRSFGQEETELAGRLSGWYQPKTFQPNAATPAAPATPPAAAPAAIALDAARKIEIISWAPDTNSWKYPAICDIAGTRIDCRTRFSQEGIDIDSAQQGTISGGRVEFRERMRIQYNNNPDCRSAYEVASTAVYTLMPDGNVRVQWNGGTGRFTSWSGKCGDEAALRAPYPTPPSAGVGIWRVLE